EVFRNYNKASGRELFNIPVDKKVILFISESIENERKGFDLFLKAIEILGVRNDYILVAVGSSDKNYNIGNLINIQGVHDERLMALLYSSADMCVIPSREDNLPNVMLESMACGTPVIGFPVGGIKETIIDGFNGLLCGERSAQSLADAIERFLERDCFDTVAIRNDSVKKFALNVQANAYIDVYKSHHEKVAKGDN
ncbi:MAG TPA: glycosyltransferase, partial [Puia sp.]|nr:glycosyltransferase [Puia sp.]